eukprot:gene21913-28372_t
MFGSQWILGGHQSLGGLFECFNNIIPSCLLAFFCPCILFAQVAVRSQIPFLIALKNSIVLFRRFSALLDAMISICCLPCSLAQLARHVFQYDRWDPPIGFYLRDPSLLPPLLPAGSITRPEIADTAGLQWLDNRAIPGTRDNTGLAHRREIMNEQINIQIDRELDRGIDRHIDRNTNRQIDKELDRHITPAASAPASSIVYNADGGTGGDGGLGGMSGDVYIQVPLSNTNIITIIQDQCLQGSSGREGAK